MFWNCVRSRRNGRNNLVTLKVDTDTLTSEDLTHLPNFPQVVRTEYLTQVSTTLIEVGKLMRELNANKSCRPDDTHPRILKHCSNSLALLIPDDWKIANVISLYKKGAKDKVESYRPVSLTSTASKICEKTSRKSIVNFWTDHKVFIGEQFGFIKKRYCLSQLLDTFHSWAKARNARIK